MPRRTVGDVLGQLSGLGLIVITHEETGNGAQPEAKAQTALCGKRREEVGKGGFVEEGGTTVVVALGEERVGKRLLFRL